MRGSFDAYWPHLLEVEGGYGNDRRDPGNWTGGKVGVGRLLGTKYGIAANTYPNEDIRNLTVERAKFLYLRDYMPKTGFDQLPAGVDIVIGDYGINSGPSRANKDLERQVGTPVDGRFDANTLELTRAQPAVEIIKGVSSRRLSFMRALRIWETYKGGWTKRVAKIEALGFKLALAFENLTPGEISSRTEAEKKEREKAAKKANDKAVGTGAGGAAGGAGTSQVPDVEGLPPKTMLIIVLVIAAIGVAYFMWRKHTETVRAKAYARA